MTLHLNWRTRVVIAAIALGILAFAMPITRAQARQGRRRVSPQGVRHAPSDDAVVALQGSVVVVSRSDERQRPRGRRRRRRLPGSAGCMPDRAAAAFGSGRSRRDVAAGLRPRGVERGRRRRRRAVEPEHRLGRHRRGEHLPQLVRRATASTSRPTAGRPGSTWAWPTRRRSAASSSTRPTRTSSTWRRWATSGRTTRARRLQDDRRRQDVDEGALHETRRPARSTW